MLNCKAAQTNAKMAQKITKKVGSATDAMFLYLPHCKASILTTVPESLRSNHTRPPETIVLLLRCTVQYEAAKTKQSQSNFGGESLRGRTRFLWLGRYKPNMAQH
jgi:hypothetical protein